MAQAGGGYHGGPELSNDRGALPRGRRSLVPVASSSGSPALYRSPAL
jgi:hypothetical protein